MKLILSTSPDGKYYVTGDIEAILKNKRARLLLRSELPYDLTDDSIIFQNQDISIKEITDLLKIVADYTGVEVVYDTIVSSGHDIKNNICDVKDFKHFETILDNYMTHRHLYPLQMLSAYHMAFSQNACNFSVPGAGKTSIVYGAYTYLHALNADNPKHVDRILIVGPLSSFGPWELEYEECFGRKAKSQRIDGSLSLHKKRDYFCSQGAELTLISYQSISSVVDDVEFYLRQNKVMLVLDEAHKIYMANVRCSKL